MTKKEALMRPSLRQMLESLLSRDGDGLWHDSKDWRECKYSCHVDWVKPLVDQGFIVHVGQSESWPASDDEKFAPRKRFNYHKFTVTPEGIKWWAAERIREAEADGSVVRVEVLGEPHGYNPPIMEGKGIGSKVHLYWNVDPGIKGIRDGYFDFIAFHSYRADISLDIQLTEAGMRFFDSMPKLQLECA